MSDFLPAFLKALEEDEKQEQEFVNKLKGILLSLDARIKILEAHSHTHQPLKPQGVSGE